jgi:hypothetical protein
MTEPLCQQPLFQAGEQSLADVLGRVRCELAAVAHAIDHMQSEIGALTRQSAGRDPDYIRAMQEVDHSAQLLAGLADFLGAVAQMTPAGWRLDPNAASEIVRLSELSARLAADESRSASPAPSGDCHFF